MHFNFVTLFPSLLQGYFSDSILGKALQDRRIGVSYVDPRKYSQDKHFKVDDTPCGGGSGMVMATQPLYDALEPLAQSHIIYLSPTGKPFNAKDAKVLTKHTTITLICGRYEGVDERVIETFCDEVYGVSDAVVTGGELPALMVCDAISRHLPGVLGSEASLLEESFEQNALEAPSFTKPKTYQLAQVPSVLLNGNHSHIDAWRHQTSFCKTCYARVDLFHHLQSH